MEIKIPVPISSTPMSVEPSNSLVDISLSANPQSHRLLISLIPPKQPTRLVNDSKRAPLDICCVIDVSESMSSDAPIPGDPGTGGKAEATGLTVLDVVKHSLRTIIATMKDGKSDQFAIRPC
jgi:hypothetical protein